MLIRLFPSKTLVILGVLITLGTVLAFRHIFLLSTRMIETTTLQGAILHSQLLKEFRTLYTSEVVERVQGRGIEVTHDYKKKPGAIPLPVTLAMELSERVGKHGSNIEVRLFSDYPFPWRKDGGPQDMFEQEALNRLRENPSVPFYRFEKDTHNRLNLRYATADRMRPSCISCHNSHPSSPKKDWKVGDVRGVLEVNTPVLNLNAQNNDIFRTTYIAVGSTILLAFISLLLSANRLRRTALELDVLVMEQTIHLQQANVELEAFSYSVSHDLRSPLTLMKGYSEVLFDQYGPKLDEQGRGLLRKISQATDRMNQMTEDLLNLSRAESLPLRRETIGLSALAATIAEDLSVSQPGRQVEFLIEPGLTAQGDPNLLRLALENLLRNAWKYTGKKSAAKIEFGKTTENADDVFFIRDNGAGFDMSQVDKLFGVFQRLHTAQEFPGTGVGLGTVARIIKRHGGRIWAEGKPGAGATFYFTLA